MSADRAARLVTRWVRFYTRDLPAPVAERRAGEVAADVHDHVADERARGTGEMRIALAVLARVARGAGADVTWRRGHTSVARSTLGILVGVAVLLAVPLVAGLAGGGVDWTPLDFAVAAVVLAAVGFSLRGAVRRTRGALHRAGAALGIGTAFLLVWVNGAVGVVGSEDEAINAMYAGVVAVFALGTLLVRLRPRGMAAVALAAAAAQALAAGVALAAGGHDAAQVIGVNGLFAALFVASALLFSASASNGSSAGSRR